MRLVEIVVVLLTEGHTKYFSVVDFPAKKKQNKEILIEFKAIKYNSNESLCTCAYKNSFEAERSHPLAK